LRPGYDYLLERRLSVVLLDDETLAIIDRIAETLGQLAFRSATWAVRSHRTANGKTTGTRAISLMMASSIDVDLASDDDARAAAKGYVAALEQRLRERGLEVSSVVVFGPSVAAAIVARAEERACDMIVMSSQALTGAARALFGSVADAVVRQAHCSVLVAHRPVETENTSATDEPVAELVAP
jgi:nucleotide-binding universal stress UspA family protein